MSRRQSAWLLVALAAAGCRPSTSSSGPDGSSGPPAPTGRVVVEAAGGAVAVRVEVARTREAQQRGLMHRTRLDPDAGMIFVFPEEAPHSFWMKNTLVPLDLIFISAAGKVAAIVERAPLGTESDDGGVASRYVLEVNRGWSRQHGVKVGDPVRFENVLF